MKAALIHGALLLVMLVYGYRTWTRDTSVSPDVGSISLWQKSASALRSVEYKAEGRIVRLEKRTDGGGEYWWGLETTISKRPKPTPPPAAPPTAPADATKPAAPPAAPADATKPATPADPTKPAAPADPTKPAEPAKPAEPEMEEVRTVTEFPTGEAVDKLVKLLASARVMRSLGTVSEADKKTYKLDDQKTTLTVSFADGNRTFVIGGQVYGGSDRYVLEGATGKGYVFSRELLTSLEGGFTSLRLADPRGFELADAKQVTITAGGKTRTAIRVASTSADGQASEKWGDAATKKVDQTLANFVDNTLNLQPTSFDPAVKMSDLTPVLTLAYRDGKGNALGEVKLFKRTRAAEMPADGTGDPANPPPPVVEYFLHTAKTRVMAQVNRSVAERAEQDLGALLQ